MEASLMEAILASEQAQSQHPPARLSPSIPPAPAAPDGVPVPKAPDAPGEPDEEDFDEMMLAAITSSLGGAGAAGVSAASMARRVIPSGERAAAPSSSTSSPAAAAASADDDAAPALARAPSNMKTSLSARTLRRCLSNDGSGEDGGTCVMEEEKRADMEYDHSLAQSLATGTQFQDPDFAAAPGSIGSGKGTVTVRVRDASTGSVETREVPIAWLRPAEMGRRDLGQERWVLSRMAPSGADVAQGSEGDCWLLSAMSVAAEGEGHIAHALRSAEADGCGAVQVRLCLGGLWTVVTVDDRIPCDSLSRNPVFARGGHSQLWPCMIEKGEPSGHAESGSVRSREALLSLGGPGLQPPPPQPRPPPPLPRAPPSQPSPRSPAPTAPFPAEPSPRDSDS